MTQPELSLVPASSDALRRRKYPLWPLFGIFAATFAILHFPLRWVLDGSGRESRKRLELGDFKRARPVSWLSR